MQDIRAVERIPVPRIAWGYFRDYFSMRYKCREDEHFGLFACREYWYPLGIAGVGL